jgi:hypothetical protein
VLATLFAMRHGFVDLEEGSYPFFDSRYSIWLTTVVATLATICIRIQL